MGTAASTFLNPILAERTAQTARVNAHILARRRRHRRQWHVAQATSYGLGAALLLIYVHAGTISILIPAAFFMSGVTFIGFFAVLSDAQFNNRFEDHYLTAVQAIGHVAIQLGFLLAAPQIGYAFLNVIFLIFGAGSLRMTLWQVSLAWILAAIAVTVIFVFVPVGMPLTTTTERLAAALCFVATIGQCAFVGLYGDALRKKLYRRSVQLSEAYKRIEELAELDELTGSFNRRSIMRMLDEEIARSERNGSPCSVALIDLDHFKRVNDTYGHPTGDEVLRTFAITMFANIRSVDRFGRYGGEEFLLVLPDLPNDGAARALDRLRAIVADLDWSAFSPGMQVTLSAGVATLNPDETTDNFLARADSALYAAKAQGRNRIARA
jgi:diguanylate cyclase